MENFNDNLVRGPYSMRNINSGFEPPCFQPGAETLLENFIELVSVYEVGNRAPGPKESIKFFGVLRFIMRQKIFAWTLKTSTDRPSGKPKSLG